MVSSLAKYKKESPNILKQAFMSYRAYKKLTLVVEGHNDKLFMSQWLKDINSLKFAGFDGKDLVEDSYKKIQISNKKGFIVVSNDERQPNLEIPLSSLSSGEQHLIVLIGQLIFSISEGSLVLIDEPEISFHPEWQEQFLSIRAQYDEGRIREMSFPTRLIDSLNNDTEVTKDDINNKIQNIQEFEEKYGKLGLVPTSETTQKLSVQAQSTEHAGMLVLKTYLSDILDKFKLLEGLSKKLDVFISSINNLISFKKIQEISLVLLLLRTV